MIARIAMISEHASPLAALGGVDSGGQNVYVGQLAKHLATIGYKVDVFTRRDNDCSPEVIKSISGVRIIHIPAGPPRFVRKEDLLPHMDEFADNLSAFMAREQRPYSLVHANFWMSGLVAKTLKQGHGLPFVVTFHALGRVRRLHQPEADAFPAERPAIEEQVIADADAILAECPQDKADLIQLYNARASKIAIIPCGFDAAELWPIGKREARDALGLAKEERLVLQLGRMVPRKGVDTVVTAIACLQRRHGVAARLLVVGGESDLPDPSATPEIGRLQRLAASQGICDSVVFTGRCSRRSLRYYYGAADIFVATPWYEPFGITPVEAMACGRPVIGSAVGGIRTTVIDGETGFLVPPRDPDAVADRLFYLYSNPELMERFGQTALERAKRHFTWASVARHAARLYNRVIEAQPVERWRSARSSIRAFGIS